MHLSETDFKHEIVFDTGTDLIQDISFSCFCRGFIFFLFNIEIYSSLLIFLTKKLY